MPPCSMHGGLDVQRLSFGDGGTLPGSRPEPDSLHPTPNASLCRIRSKRQRRWSNVEPGFECHVMELIYDIFYYKLCKLFDDRGRIAGHCGHGRCSWYVLGDSQKVVLGGSNLKYDLSWELTVTQYVHILREKYGLVVSTEDILSKLVQTAEP